VLHISKNYIMDLAFVVNLNDATHSLHILIHRNFQYFKERNSVVSLVDIVQFFQSHIAQIYCFEIKGATAPGIVR